MRIVKFIVEAVKRDKTYLIVGLITLSIVAVLLKNHQWQSQPRQALQPVATNLPEFKKIKPVAKRKQAFFNYLLPFIRQENQKILYDRSLLFAIEKELTESSPHHRTPHHKLRKLARRYYYEISDVEEALAELKLRIDVVPESLVLVQAAKESAWGTSRFARQANNLFGHWCFSKGCGIVPNKRNKDSDHEIRRFESPQMSVVLYMRNLNSHSAYLEMRQIRAQLRQAKKPITGVKLAQGLDKYSERREKYVDEIVKMIGQNDLE